MMVTFVCECEKKALLRTRRVLDAFANRIGSRTWQTVITDEGLQAVKKLLRKSATKNTAVSCHWIRSRSRSELVWIVGNRNKFNPQGVVPVNSTQKDLLKHNVENNARNTEVIAVFAAIAGLFHDFGKANALFQNKLNPEYHGKRFEPYRHEWVSLRLFQAFVGEKNDIQWLELLKNVNESEEKTVLSRLIKDTTDTQDNAFLNLPPIAKMVAWLIVSHHRLPVYPKEKANTQPDFQYINRWLESVDSLWNSTSSFDEWEESIRTKNWSFPYGTPLSSKTWQAKAKELATRAFECHRLVQQNWFEQRFTAHLARLVLMLSDHYYSSLDATVKWQDKNYKAYANTHSETKEYKQKLDEHNIGVGINAYILARALPKLRAELPVLGINKNLSNGIKNLNGIKDITKSRWQDKAYKLAESLREKTQEHGFFGINMASTGLGKTLANARIMYALSDEKIGCRFSVALGLRTLTLQTGKALQEKLELDESELAILIGSQAVKQLHQNTKDEFEKEQEKNKYAIQGSESLEALAGEFEIEYEGSIYKGILNKWLEKSPKINKLIQAPVLVSTIDYLIPATEGYKGGKQIAPMLRLFTSDLVLDEPDEFGLDDLPALCRLVNWAGMLGSRVLLSTATMPPALAYALFEAYQAGWKDYTEVNAEKGSTEQICCAWFDEFDVKSEFINDKKNFSIQHHEFVKKRIEHLNKDKNILRKARFLPIESLGEKNIIEQMAATISNAIHLLHKAHKQTHLSGKTVSIGLVRMANINPLVAVAKELFSIKPEADYQIHYCVYHGQYPLAIRSYIEEKLDAALTRYNEESVWQQPEIAHAIKNEPEKHHIFVVLATSVAEVGRDHDYDWAIAEPSSMRSLIQLAGRIQRHRKKEPEMDNLLILSKNIKALNNKIPAYCRPGFEITGQKQYDNNDRVLNSRDLSEVLPIENIKHINAIPRIQSLKGKAAKQDNNYLNFVEMEQWALFQRLLGFDNEKDNASYWWNNQLTWCAEIQRRQPFRKSSPDEPYYLLMNEDEDIYWASKDDTKKPIKYPPAYEIETIEFKYSENNHWFKIDIGEIYVHLSEKLDLSIEQTSQRFGEIRLRINKEKFIQWHYNEYLGIHELFKLGDNNE